MVWWCELKHGVLQYQLEAMPILIYPVQGGGMMKGSGIMRGIVHVHSEFFSVKVKVTKGKLTMHYFANNSSECTP